MISQIADKVLENKKFLQRVGLYDMSYEIDELSAKEHSLLAKSACEFARTLVANEIRTSSFYSHRPPCAFLAYLSPKPADKMLTLQHVENLWFMLGKAEKCAIEHDYIKKHLQIMQWPFNALAREWMVGAFEADFMVFPSDIVKDEMIPATRTFATSKYVEATNSIVVDCARQSKAGMLGVKAKWHRVLTSGVLKEADRLGVQHTIEDQRASRGCKISKTFFDAARSKFSLGEEMLENVERKDYDSRAFKENFNFTIVFFIT